MQKNYQMMRPSFISHGNYNMFEAKQLKPEDIQLPQYNHLDNLKLWVKDCQEISNPWSRWEYKMFDDWLTCEATIPMFFSNWQYRRKPLQYYINDTEIKLGFTHREYEDAKKSKMTIYLANILNHDFYSELDIDKLDIFTDKQLDHYLKLRLFYDNKEDAIHRTKHMGSWVVKECNNI